MTTVFRSDDAAPLAARDVRLAWSAFLKLVFEPAGWKAILNPSPDTAKLLNTEAGRQASPMVDATYDSLEAKV